MTDVLVSVEFEAEIIEWRGPAPYLFVQIPEEHFGEIRFAAREVSYGWGVVPVSAEINGHEFTTALFPREDSYLLPVKVAVQRAAKVGLGDRVSARIRIDRR